MTVWICFLTTIFLFLAIDLGVFNKNSTEISSKSASKWTLLWVSLAFLFSAVVFWIYNNNYIENPTLLKPSTAVLKYITGYLIELSLSVDNIFVIAIIFKSFKIPKIYQHKILFWGIVGALFFRGIMIYFGVLILNKFSWTTYVFGLFLVYTAFKMAFTKGDEEDFNPKKSFVYNLLQKIMPTTNQIQGSDFWITENHQKLATPLFIVLIIVEVMDVVFALDSVPAILAITSDPFLVFSSNIFAILGLRSMYFFIANMLDKFGYLEQSLIAILGFIGIKMLVKDYIILPEWASLGFIALALTIGVIASLSLNKKRF